MPRAPDNNKEKAKELYDKGYRLIEIASQLTLPEGTIRSWKNRYKWDKCNATEKEKKCNVAKIETVKEVMQNNELTEKEKLFCLYFAKSLNATRSYMKAYDTSYGTSNTLAFRVLAKDSVKAEVERLKQERYTKAFLRTEDIFQKYMDIAFSDISDYLEWGMEDIKDEDDKSYKYNYAHFKNSTEVDGSIVSELSFSPKGGVKVKLHDKLKALEWLADHMDMATEEQKLRIAKLKAETAKLKDDEDEDIDDGFVEALKGKVDEVWEE